MTPTVPTRRRAQIALPLDWSAGGANADWPLVGAANADAIHHLQSTHSWRVPVAVLTGPPRSGRSTIARWFEASGGRAIDDADGWDETALFHAFNDAVAGAAPPTLLVAGAVPGAGWRAALPDLASRLASVPVLRIADPDPALAAAVVELMLARRGLAAVPGVADYCVRRIERSWTALAALVDALDAATLGTHRPPTLALARRVVAETGLGAPDLFGDADHQEEAA